VAPLAGFSCETLEQAEAELRALGDGFPEVHANDATWDRTVLNTLSDAALRSSARCGLETALLDLVARESGEPWHHRLTGTYRQSVSCNALLVGEDMAGEARARVGEGYRSLKLKVGVTSPESDADAVLAVHAAAGDDVAIRLDANRAWSLDDAVRFAERLEGCPIEYIEEPVDDPAVLSTFRERSALPVAVDESFAELAEADLRGVAAIVIKPTLYGGISGALKRAATARTVGATPVISAAFESGVGLRALAQLAACVCDSGTAVGLDTWRWMAEDVSDPPFRVAGGRVEVGEGAGPLG